MPVPGQAASGPSGDAGEEVGGMSLGDAISAVMDGNNQGGGAPQGDIDDVLTDPRVAAKAESRKVSNTGDDRAGEDTTAAAEGDKATDPAAPEGDAKELLPPKHWTQARKDVFAKIPAEGQKAMLEIAKDLEGGYTRRSQELADESKFAKAVRGVFDDNTRQQLRRAGTDEVGAIQYLVKLQQFASQDGPRYVVWAMQNLGVTPDMIGLAPRTTGEQPAQPSTGKEAAKASPTGDPKLDELLRDPAVEQLRTELASAAKEIEGLKGKMTARERQEYEYAQQQNFNQTQSLHRMIAEFRSALDDNGQLAYPHFDAVYRQMGAIMDTDPRISRMADGADKMAAAYRKVVAGDEELSKPLIEAEVNRRLAAQRKQEEAARAKRAAAVKPAVGAPTARPRPNSLDEAIAGAFTSRGY